AGSKRHHAVEHVEPKPERAKRGCHQQKCRSVLRFPKAERGGQCHRNGSIGDRVRMNSPAHTQLRRRLRSTTEDLRDRAARRRFVIHHSLTPWLRSLVARNGHDGENVTNRFAAAIVASNSALAV